MPTVEHGPAGDLHDAVATLLRDAGQRYTRSWRAVIEVLAVTARPITLPEILAVDGQLTQSSTYRNLVVLERLIAHECRFSSGKSLCFDPVNRYDVIATART